MIKLTRKQAIQWAHDAGLINKEDYSVEHMGALADDIQRLASVAYEAGQKDEREACAALHDSEDVLAPVGQSAWGEAYQDGWIAGVSAYRKAIRARGKYGLLRSGISVIL